MLLVIEDILNNKVECTICNDDLLNEIILKKIIMVHQTHLFLCCQVSSIKKNIQFKANCLNINQPNVQVI